MPGANGKKSCFVVMGFGEKTDFQSNPQRILNLDKTFEYIIQPAVEECGLECIRADKIIHSTVIDKPMYEHLLEADLVIADLSTSNANAIYELGVRHALRPNTTIVMAEQNFKFPFDLNHVSMLTYEHLGKEIGFGEVVRVRKVLKDKILHLDANQEVDSPVFLFLPSLAHAAASVLSSAGETTRAQSMESAAAHAPALSAPPVSDASFAELTENFHKAKAAVKEPADWLTVIAFLKALQTMQPNDPYVIQQLALATYKSELPDKLSALRKAKDILAPLAPATSSDAETVGLWGAVHKRLWQEGGDRADLDRAIRAYARGYFLKTDYWNGINFAYLLNVRSSISAGDEAIADRVQARRIRSEVLALCEDLEKRGGLNAADAFWALATKVEAKVGLGAADAEALLAEAQRKAPEPWMAQTLVEQIANLRAVLG
jgi:MAP3K TRAFs-binding domain